MLPTLIQRYGKKSFHFKNERLTEFLQAVREPFFNDYFNTICQSIKSFLDNKMSTFEEYGAVGTYIVQSIAKTRLFKYIENFTSKNLEFSDKKTLIFFILLLKT